MKEEVQREREREVQFRCDDDAMAVTFCTGM